MGKGKGKGEAQPPVELDPEAGRALYDTALDAHSKGHRLFSCVVTVATFVGAPVKVTQRATSVHRVTTDELLAAIEGIGWRLEHVSHVYVQTTTSANAGFGGMSIAGISGQVDAHYTFRRVQT